MSRYMFSLWPTRSRSARSSSLTNEYLQQQEPCLEPNPELRQDSSSASVNIEDIIEDYDDASRKSRAASLISLLNSARLSQSYLSLSGTKDDETSFYSALQDFTTENEYISARDNSLFSNDFLWLRDNKESENMLARQEFQVNWYDINYEIKPQISLTKLWGILKNGFRYSLVTTRDVFACSKSSDYDVKDPHAVERVFDEDSIKILKHVSGSFKSGELTAIMGPSGAGKTSLLNFLSRRREDGFTGQLYLDNANHKIKIYAIPQQDHLPGYLSVRENLIFASYLKNTHPDHDHERIVDRVSRALGLDDCIETRTKNISGGQLKRLAIAQELLSKPDILILDEPTSGLDSLTCFKTLSVLKDLVRSSEKKNIDPIAIVLTIHQPQHEVFDLFDKVYVMAMGGVVIYDGPPGSCVEFVKRYAGITMPNQDYNPASFMIEIASGEYGQGPIDALARQVIVDFEERRDKATSEIAPGSILKKPKSPREANGTRDENGYIPTWRKGRNVTYIDSMIAKASTMNEGNFWRKTAILSKRSWISIIRDPLQFIARILFHIMLPIGLALLMGTEPGRSNACPHHKSEIQMKELVEGDDLTNSAVFNEYLFTLENLGTFFVMIYALVSANIGATTLSFTLDIQNSLKEYYNGWYTMPSYIVARLVTNAPMDFCLPMMAVAIGYMATGQFTGTNPDKMPDVYRIVMTALAVSLGSMIGQLMGMIIGAIYIGHVTAALFMSQGASLPLVLVSGAVVRTKSLPAFVRAFSGISFFKHVVDLTFLLRWGYSVCDCNTNTTFSDIRVVGVGDNLRSFINNWLSMNTDPIDVDQAPQTITTTVLPISQPDEVISASNLTTNEVGSNGVVDIFDTVGKQVYLFNTYGVELRSCADVKPFQLTEFELSERDLVPGFLILAALWASAIFLLMVTVKIVIHFRTSL